MNPAFLAFFHDTSADMPLFSGLKSCDVFTVTSKTLKKSSFYQPTTALT